MKNKILVFGSNGLVGSSISEKLLRNQKNYDVISSTREDTDLFNLKKTVKTIEDIKPNTIINAAAKVGGIYANDTKRTEFIIENLKINMNILEACIPFPEIKIINLGSSCIYPLNAKNPISEESFMGGKLENTNSPYAMAKLSAIEIGRALSKQYGHKVINLMPTNLYGPNDNFSKSESHVIPGMISRMHEAMINEEKNFEIWGTGKPKREFLYVEDLSDAIKFIIENNIEDDLINIGSGEEINIYELANLVKKTLQYDVEFIFDDSKPDGNPRKFLDSSLINSYGWKAKTNLESGLQYTYKWFLDNVV
ncbi:MAG: GDP-fucose synthetase [Flavobacteriaceae bacterium]|nr:GDP-fucose synthetase [Flavobacteriaceae bacterium]